MSDFLTLEEIKDLGLHYHEYAKSVYEYMKDGYYTLVEDGKVLIEGVEWVYWYEKGLFKYKKDGSWTLCKILIEDADDVEWYSKGVYKYKKDGKESVIRIDMRKEHLDM
jgi:hypothetical protein